MRVDLGQGIVGSNSKESGVKISMEEKLGKGLGEPVGVTDRLKSDYWGVVGFG